MEQELIDLLERWPVGREFDLPRDSSVIVVGAYKGITMELLHNLYRPKYMIGYEPQLWAAQKARERMLPYEGVMVFSYGLGTTNGNFEMGEFLTDACSFVNVGVRERGNGELREANEALNLLGFIKIDLVVMNIEGYEFYLLPHLERHGWFNRIDRLAIQFHFGFGNDQNYNEIIALMDNKYKREYDALPNWGYWCKS